MPWKSIASASRQITAAAPSIVGAGGVLSALARHLERRFAWEAGA